jgi:hypothetical protein
VLAGISHFNKKGGEAGEFQEEMHQYPAPWEISIDHTPSLRTGLGGVFMNILPRVVHRIRYMPGVHRQMLRDFSAKMKDSGTVRDYVEGAKGAHKGRAAPEKIQGAYLFRPTIS